MSFLEIMSNKKRDVETHVKSATEGGGGGGDPEPIPAPSPDPGPIPVSGSGFSIPDVFPHPKLSPFSCSAFGLRFRI